MAKTTTKAKKATPPATTPDKRTLAPHELVLSPTIQSAVGIKTWGKFAGEVDLAELVKELRERVEKVQGGDIRPVEAMLFGQAMTLEAIFTSLAQRAASQEYLKQFQAYLGLALKAQAQCRATLEALAEIKNPRPLAFVKQANISGGPQQVNNGMQPAQQAVLTTSTCARAHAGQNHQLEKRTIGASHGIELDTRSQSTAGGADPYMEAVATGHRPLHA